MAKGVLSAIQRWLREYCTAGDFEGKHFHGLITLNIFVLQFSRIAQVSEATPINEPRVCVYT